MTSDPSAITLARDGELSIVTLNRPEKMNALDPAMIVLLDELLMEADADDETRAIVITGAGRAFSAGGDVSSFGSRPDTRVHRRGWRLAR